MPYLGRWGVVDPLAEKAQDFAPYRYGYNNPILFIDPTGMLETDFVDIESGLITHIENGKDQFISSDKKR
ncbi:hypothetical protein [Epilithonimonas sp.]|uniref:hypothetical protein n=1 Tax=Epilithonimonas sp. TaxID=2894511 RepID=UPI00289BD626|nr:hypothetical protein [Epilithonimonas sp.]